MVARGSSSSRAAPESEPTSAIRTKAFSSLVSGAVFICTISCQMILIFA